MKEVKLEAGKNYEIKRKDGETDRWCGNHIISGVLGVMFSIVGIWPGRETSLYDFVRLPSFGDEIERPEGMENWKHYYYWGEIDGKAQVFYHDGEKKMDACIDPKLINLLAPSPETYEHTNGKKYNKAEVDKMIEGLIAVD